MRHRLTFKKSDSGYRVALGTVSGKIVCTVFMDSGDEPRPEEEQTALKQARDLTQALTEAIDEKLVSKSA